MKNKFKWLFQPENRMKNLLKQTGFSFLFKIIAMGCNFLLVPLTLNYLGREQYGIWMTMLTVLSWMSFCDFGLGNGMRNKVTLALAKKDINSVREYISSTYFSILLLMLILIITLIIIEPFLNWQSIFNTTYLQNAKLAMVGVWIFILMSLNFFFSLINQVANAYQQSALTVLNQLMGNVFAFILTYIVIQTTEDSLFLIAFVYAFSLVVANMLISLYFYRKNFNVIPRLKFFKWNRVKELTSLSIRFFIIQIAALVFFAKDNIIITQVLGPEYVTPYNITFKYFNVILFGVGILLTPLWSALGDAYASNDIQWIKRTMRKMNLLMIPLIICVICLCIISPMIFELWIGAEAKNINSLLIWCMGIFAILSVWNNIYATFLNATGKLKLSMYSTIVMIIVNIPLAIYLAKEFGLLGVISTTIICMLAGSIMQPIQYRIILNEKKLSVRSWCYQIFCK